MVQLSPQEREQRRRLAKYGKEKPDDAANRKKLEEVLKDLDKKWHKIKKDSSIQFEQKAEMLKNVRSEINAASGSLTKILKRQGVFS